MQLRPYQSEAVAAVYDHLRNREDHPCVVIPTAGGKTPVMASLCRDAVQRWNGRVLILAHVKELLEQAVEKLHAMAPDLWMQIGVYSAGLKSRDTDHPIIVAGIQSVYKRASELDAFDLILIDEVYEPGHGDFSHLPCLTEDQRDRLMEAAWSLNEYIPKAIQGPERFEPLVPIGETTAPRPGDDYNQRGELCGLLEEFGWVQVSGGANQKWRRPGKDSGWSATFNGEHFYVFSSNAMPFEPNRAYTPFAVYALLHHGGDYEQAARDLRDLGYGGDSLAEISEGVDLSGLLAPIDEVSTDMADPGPIPEDLFQVPGFIAQVMDFTLANAPYPNLGLSFCGALSLQSYLCGRKVCFEGTLRPNIYLLALASSGTGKDYPRKVNAHVMLDIGCLHALGDKFASGEGLADALQRNGAMLFQNDEMDGVLRQINSDRENKRESIPNILLTMYTNADSTYPMRAKAGKEEAGHIDQPHLTLFGTATPKHFYESLSQRMLTNGLFARMMVIDIGKRSRGQRSGNVRNVPESVLQTARWWSEFRPGSRRGNLQDIHPEPREVRISPDAQEAANALRDKGDDEYDLAYGRKDEVSRIAWSRLYENAMKLALLRACSVNHEDPVIDLPAIEWASAFAMHQTRRQLFMAQSYVSETQFDGDCLKLLRKLREASDQQIPHQVLLKRMKMKAKDFKELIETLIQRGDVVPVAHQTTGRSGVIYQIAGVKKGEGR
jgi:hypothetical protein